MVKIELKNITHNERLSDETHCYSATLFVDGVKWGEVGNHGHGGCDHFHPVAGRSYDDLKALDERIAAEYPPNDLTDIGCPGETMPQSLEVLCAEAVNTFLVERDLKRTLKANLTYFQAAPTDKGAPLYTISLKKAAGWSVERLAAHVAQKHPGAVVLNTMPLDEALRLFRMAA